MKILVTGGAGFIGSAVVRHVVHEGRDEVVNLDKLTYAASPASLTEAEKSPRYAFEKADIADGVAVRRILDHHAPDAIMHLAAESHVDRSIDGPADFIQTNIVGTFRLLEAALEYYRALSSEKQRTFRFHHVSTDEVFGSLGPDDAPFDDATPYDPRSPYSASKAASDHLALAWHHTYGLPVVLSNCSNNYGPYQFPEKMVPMTITRALTGQPLPVYGKGENVRDWLFVEDHARALLTILRRGHVGETYLVGGEAERRNIDLVEAICAVLDDLAPRKDGKTHATGISFVADRPGHDLRYAIDWSRTEAELGWRPGVRLEEGLRRTVEWYIANRRWWQPLIAEKDAARRRGLGHG